MTTQDKGAMERALQQADGPRRRILEASRSKNAVKPDTPASAPAETPPPARPAQAAAPAAPRPVREEPPPKPVSVIVTMPGAMQPLAVPDRTKVEEVRAVAAPEKLAEPVALIELAPARQAAASAPEAAASVPPVAVALPAPAPRSAPPPAERQAATTQPPPRLVSKVDPELPPRLLRRGLLRTEVLVSLTINPDGSVSDVNVRPTSNAELDAAVLEAVRQWRYETQPAARPYQLLLVVSPS